MFDKIINLYEKYKGIILYGIFGILTTVINFVLYFLFVNLFSVNYLISNCIAWIGAVIFAFYTNKIYVFESKNNELGNVFKEFILFTGSRAFTFFIETLLLFLGVELLKLNNGIVKIAIAVIVVILNYVFTKFVFKNNIQDIKIVGKKTEKRIWYKNYYLIYTIIFIIACFIIYLPFIFEGKSFFYNYDGVSQHYNSLVYFGKYIRSIIKNLLLNHQLIIPMWDLSVGFGQDILTSLNYYSIGDVLDILFVLTPIKFSSYMYVFLILFRMFLSGICFSLYCFKMKQSKYSTLVGTLCYVFCGYVIFSSIRHPFFIKSNVIFTINFNLELKIF
ncbi:GtrA family protein [Anaerofustis stercorihominis]|nr:GtrA family protein [Anaerofustis stercorihominis]